MEKWFPAMGATFHSIARVFVNPTDSHLRQPRKSSILGYCFSSVALAGGPPTVSTFCVLVCLIHLQGWKRTSYMASTPIGVLAEISSGRVDRTFSKSEGLF